MHSSQPYYYNSSKLEEYPICPLKSYQLIIEWNKEREVPSTTENVERKVCKHCNEKGLVLTTSYQQLYKIREGLSLDNDKRLIDTGNREDSREEIIKAHKTSTDPTVLISPSLWNGIDLKDDTSRFQIIVKTPYLDLGDGRILAKRNWMSKRLIKSLVIEGLVGCYEFTSLMCPKG